MDHCLEDKTALVTGGSGGIGSSVARALAEAGADVTVGYHSDREGAEKTAQAVRSTGREATIYQCDVSDVNAVEGLFEHHTATFGDLDICINNAGIDGTRGVLWELDADDWIKVLEVNLRGGFAIASGALKRMVAAKSGVLLSVTSVHEHVPWGGHSAYCASKSAIAMMTRCLALEVGSQGVRTVCLAPGAIRTEINQDMWSDPAKLADLEAKTPLGRIGETDEIARLAVALCSETASYVTGTTVFADGGMSAYPSFASGG